MLDKEGRLAVSGMSLEYSLTGPQPAQSPAIVMLHEGLGSVSTWGDFPRRLFERTGAGVFAYSRPGYGASPPVEPGLPLHYIRRHALEVLPAILDAIGFKCGLLLGHSDGASMAASYAGNVEDARVRGLALIAPHFCVEAETLAEIRNARAAFETGDLRQRLARRHRFVDAAFRGWNDVWLRPEFAAFDLSEDLARIRAPVLVLRGELDRYGTRRQVEIAEKHGFKAEVLAGCGHVPHREKPAQTVEAIGAFYEAVMPPTSAA